MLNRLIWQWRYFWQSQRTKWHVRYLKRVLPYHIDRVLKMYGRVIPDAYNDVGNLIRSHILVEWNDLKIKYDPFLHDVTIWDARFDLSLLASYDLTDDSRFRWEKLIVGGWCDDLIRWGEELYLESEKPKRQIETKNNVSLDDLFLLDEQNDEQQQQ